MGLWTVPEAEDRGLESDTMTGTQIQSWLGLFVSDHFCLQIPLQSLRIPLRGLEARSYRRGSGLSEVTSSW